MASRVESFKSFFSTSSRISFRNFFSIIAAGALPARYPGMRAYLLKSLVTESQAADTRCGSTSTFKVVRQLGRFSTTTFIGLGKGATNVAGGRGLQRGNFAAQPHLRTSCATILN